MSPSLVDMFSPLYVTERVLAEVGTTATLGEVQTSKVAMAAELEKSRKAKINITNSRKTEGRPNTLDRKADAESSSTSSSSSSSSSRSSSTNPSAQASSSSKNSSTELAKTSTRAGSLDLELEVKHPLENAWTLWFFKNDRSKKWEEMQSPVLTVRTVEDFWSLYHHIELASLLPAGTDYSLFKEGIFPDWEDRRNKEGGRWIVNVDKRQRSQCLDTYWLEVLYFLIGENAGSSCAHQMNGAVVNVRAKGDKLAVWLAEAGEEKTVVQIGKMVKAAMGIDQEQTIQFNRSEEHTSELQSP